MAFQDFAQMVESGLLLKTEGIVVDAHRGLYAAQGKHWSRPAAYRWLRYEDPAPVARLADGVRKLRRRGAKFDVEAVEKACSEASRTGFLY